ncbi:hypothetical protein MKC55_24365 [[Clostridium] innocuum]|nr:hypothetical protein [[Clostridium] innocuum]
MNQNHKDRTNYSLLKKAKLMKLLVNLIAVGVVFLLAIGLIRFVSHKMQKIIEEELEQREQYPYEAIYFENGGKNLNRFPNCYEYHEFSVCETESEDKYVVEKYWKIDK